MESDFDKVTILQATIVTADGTALTLSDTENAELFWGIRGGGSNFGVCTEFVLRLHPQRRTVFSGTIVFPTDVMDAVMAELARWWESAKDQEGILQILGRDPTGRVSDTSRFLSGTTAEQLTTQRRMEYFSLCFIMGLRKKGVKISNDFMI